ncbi:hypothetical protein [Streptomyces sp. NRRL S-337]|uniref:hypothetical protein n=1 Tax=Streptomyces sp. NRRL S-337 TaxID=1463900 RepID=UPI00131B8C7F|nr:hypothetical protein [Streptomyces sp. NRRL S-337]
MIQSDTPACRKEYGTSARGLAASSVESAFFRGSCHTSAYSVDLTRPPQAATNSRPSGAVP